MNSKNYGLWVAALGVAVAIGGSIAAWAADDPRDAFFAAFEKGDGAAALAALPADLRDASPYDAKTAALAPFPRDQALYHDLVERFEANKPVTEAAHRDAVLHAAVATIAWRDGDFERARRRFLLALRSDPFDRMTHLYLARCYAALEAEALKGPLTKSVGETLIEKVGAGSSDLHIDLAQQLVDERYPKELETVNASFLFDAGTIKEFEATRSSASGNARIQRMKVSAASRDQLLVVLLAADRTRLDEGWFQPVRTIHFDGVDAAGRPDPSRRDETTFHLNIELLSPVAAARVLIFDAKGKRIFEAPVPARAPPGK